jgi:hypothetical protein
VRWYYSQFDRPSLNKFIFYDDSVGPKAPVLPTSRIFWNKGNAVFRTGWGKDDLIFLYRAGPNFNHHHADQGSFLLTAYGENLVTEAGWSDYYKDPYYSTYFTQAIGHSTLLVDGNPESQGIPDTLQFAALNSYPRITHGLTSEFHDSLTSELASVYQGRLERFTRRIVFIKPHYFVVCDDLKARDAPARFDWLLHFPNLPAVEVTDGLTLYRGKQATLVVRAFAPNPVKTEVHAGRVPYHEFAARTPTAVPAQPAYLDLSTSPVNATRFLVALVPSKTAEGSRKLAENMVEIEDKTWSGIRSSRGTETDLVMFRIGDSGRVARYGEWSTDASTWTVTESVERLQILSAHSTRSISRSGRTLFSSDKPASFGARFSAGIVEVAFHTSGPTNVRFFVGMAPARVQLDARDVPAAAVQYERANGTVSMTIPEGQHQVVFGLR